MKGRQVLSRASEPLPDGPWELETTSLKEPYYSSYLGNGYLGVQVSRDGTGVAPIERLYQSPSLARVAPRSYIAGLYDGGPERLVELPRWSAVRFNDGRGWLAFDDPDRISGYRQTLHTGEACFSTQYAWDDDGRVTEFDITFFVSRKDPHLAVIRFSFVPHYEGEVLLESSLDAAELEKLDIVGRGSEEEAIWLETKASESGAGIAQALNMIPEDAGGFERRVDLSHGRRVSERIRLEVEGGRRCTVVKYASFFTSYESRNPSTDAKRKVVEAGEKGYERLFEEHRAGWAELWRSDILVDNPNLQRWIHSAIYHLLSSVREGQDHSIPPMGLSHDGWGGKIFWDAEFFTFPALLLLQPELARSVVMYRCRILEAARANARETGYKGAAYDWATGGTGKGLVFFGHGRLSWEIHIVGEVAWAQWQYYLATQDREFLENYGSQVIIETAEYWASRVTYNEKADRYEILGVIPPDESVTNPGGPVKVDNSAFTNAVAQWNLRAAVRVSEMLGRDYPPTWKQIADKIYLPQDPELGIYLEYEGYGGHQIKQPDVLHMIYPLDLPVGEQSVVRNFEYYEEKADWSLGHSFFPAVHPIIASMLGRRDEAYELFKQWEKFFLPPFLTMRECAKNEYRVFLSGFGGFLQNLLYGFAGIRVGDSGLAVRPCLPDDLRRITFRRIFFRGLPYRLTVENRDGEDRFELREYVD